MLEVLLTQYNSQFEDSFPLAAYAGETEIAVINLLYYCIMNNVPCTKVNIHAIPDFFPDAPHS